MFTVCVFLQYFKKHLSHPSEYPALSYCHYIYKKIDTIIFELQAFEKPVQALQ